MPAETLLAGVMLAGLVLYFLFGGADFGGGVWDLLATGPRRAAQRELIERAIGPVWEANHVWLILVVVLLLGAFPHAFSVISVALHVPLTLFLMAIVFRGAAFAFRSAQGAKMGPQQRWGRVFSLASIAGPFLLGMIVGTIASGRIGVSPEGIVHGGFFRPWLAPFPFIVGAFSLTLCAFLAATYLAHEATDPALRDDFRLRALASGVAVGAVALGALLLSQTGAPRIREGLTHRPWTWPLHTVSAACALTAFWALWRRRTALARAAVAGQSVFILLGWAASQYPYLVVPDLTLHNAAANLATLRVLIGVSALGVPIIGPSLYVLFRIFKSKRA